jgi:hypothetical protein
MKIKTILDKIDEKQLFIPAFQREYRWQRPDALKLIDSLIKEYPTGTLLIWETNKPPEIKGPHKYDERQGAVKILLDGQQRVTTLYILAMGQSPSYYEPAEIQVDPSGMWIDLMALKPEYGSDAKKATDPKWQRLTDLLQGKIDAWSLFDKFAEVGQPKDDVGKKLLAGNIKAIEKILEYDIPEQTIPIRASVREAIEIFYIVNKAGITLTDAELALAQISGYWPQARQAFKEKLSELERAGFELSLDLCVYFLLACLFSSGTELRRLHDPDVDEKVRAAWHKLSSETIDYALNLLRSYAFVDHSSELSTPFVLVPIVAWLFRKEKPSEASIKRMVRWFYLAQARQRYSVGVQQKLDTELKIIESLADPWPQLESFIAEKRPLKVMESELERAPNQNPLFTVMRWIFKARGAICLTTGTKLHQTMGEKYALERDHIFPTAVLKKHGYGQADHQKYALAQEISNRMILTMIANREKSAVEPAVYLSRAIEQFPNALKRQCIPEDQSLWTIDRFEDFLASRRKLIAATMNEYIDELSAPPSAPIEATVEELIEAGESADVEFKQTFRWDINKGQPNKKMEEVIAKAVAAFANSDGGTLLIGVHDTNGVIGLEPDLAVTGGDLDGFELALTDSLQHQFGSAFKAQYVKVSFPTVSGLKICRIDVSSSQKLLPIEITGKDGQKSKRIYIRSGNSSQELPSHEVEAYLQSRSRL